MKCFYDHHDSQMPHQLLHTVLNATNATIWSKYAVDGKARELCLGRMFSFRNGFGSIIKYEDHPESIELHHQYMQIAIRLQDLMKCLTLVEEFSIRKITPVLHIMRLSHGN